MFRSVAALAASLLGATSAYAAPTYIHAGKLIAVPGLPARGPSTIVVDEGRIVSVLDGHVPAPEGSPVIDLKSRTVLPGLIDSHVHLASDRAGNEGLAAAMTDGLPLNSYETYWNGMKTLRAGFTTVRNLGLFVQTNGGGIYRSADSAASFTKLDTGANRTRYAGLRLDPTSPKEISFGSKTHVRDWF